MVNTGLTYCISWIVLGKRARLMTLFVASCLCAHTEEVKGVLYSIHQGQGKNPAGQVSIRVGGSVRLIEYAPAGTQFGFEACYEPGSVWSGRIASSDGSAHFAAISCDGATDLLVRESWIAVRDYLRSLASGAPKRDSAFTARAQRSGDIDAYYQLTEKIDFSIYKMFGFGQRGRCLDVLEVTARRQVYIGAGLCDLKGVAGYLVFSVVSDTSGRVYQIDKIESVDPQIYWSIQSGAKTAK